MTEPHVARIRLAPRLEISRIVTGLWQVADMERDGQAIDLQAAADAMNPYVAAGFTTFDMADHYGSAEEISGLFNQGGLGRAQFFTKWVPPPGALRKKDVEAAVDLSLSRLQCDRLDLLQFHAWNYAHPSWLDGLHWLSELCDEGKIAHLGMTNTDAPHLHMLLESGFPIVSNQVAHSLLDRRAAGSLSDVCAAHDVKLLAYGTLAGGFLSQRWLGQAEPAMDSGLTWSQMKYKRFIDVAGGWDRFQIMLQTVSDVANRLDVSLSNLACRYVLENPAVGAIIVGARLGQTTHLVENQKILSFDLDTAAMEELDEAASRLDPIPGDCGDEYRRPPFLTAAGDLSDHIDGMVAPYAVVSETHRQRVLTGTVWEDLAGFSRAVRKGKRIWVSGTTATHGDRLIGGADVAAQTEFILDKIEGSLQSVGAELSDVVRTRIYIRHEKDWEPVSRVHGARFSGISPANTLVEANPIGDEYLVEIEAEAELP